MSFTLTSTIFSPEIDIELPNPQLGNTEGITTQARFQRLISGEPKMVKDNDWPVIENRRYNFAVLDSNLMDALIDFLILTAGFPVDVLDHNGDSFQALVTNTEAIRTITTSCNQNIPLELLVIGSLMPSPSMVPSP